LKREFVFEDAPTPSCHAATISQTADGSLLAAWFGGTREGNEDVAIWSSRRESSGWSAPERVAVADSVPCWNPVLHTTRTGATLLFYKAGPSPQTWTGVLKRSSDGGRSWSQAQPLPAGVLGPIKNKPLELDGGTLVCGSSVESWRAWSCWVERTGDEGATWTKHGPIALPGHPHGIIQPAVFGRAAEGVAMLCRARRTARMVRATSCDGGVSWTPPELIDLPQNNSGLDAVMTRDGAVVLVYNHTTSGRTPLNVAVSRDMGRSWTPGPVLESEPGEYSYPSVIESSDGTIHIVYTWQRQRISHVSMDPDALPFTASARPAR
jgi:predicted neuraminidase